MTQIIQIKTYQKVLSPILIFCTFLLSVIFSQILQLKPKWGWGLAYCAFGTLTSITLYLTFFYEKDFVQL